jgi:flagellar biosynthesis protein FlhG
MTLLDQATTLRSLAAGTVRRDAQPPGNDRRDTRPTAAPAAARRQPAAVIAVTSGKGGVGKSNVAVNLAAHFAAAGKDVVLFDADLGLANADVLCNIDLPYNLSHVIANKRTLREAMVKTSAGFRLIGGASGLAKMADLSDQDRSRLVNSLELLEYQADIILIDTGAGINANVLCFTRAADDVLIVTTPEPPAITDAYAVIKVIRKEGPDHPRLNLLVNQARSPAEGRLVYERISRVARQFLNVNVFDAGFVLHDENVALSVRRRTPFLLAAPRCPASQCIAQLAGRLHHGVLTPRPQPSGFFHRMSRWFWR